MIERNIFTTKLDQQKEDIPPPPTHTPDTTNHLHGSHLPVVEQQEDGLQDLIGGGRRVETARQCQDTGIDTTQ